MMSSKKHMIVGTLVGVWALLSFVGKTRHDVRRSHHNQQKVELDLWEGEGGNLPPSGRSVSATPSSLTPSSQRVI